MDCGLAEVLAARAGEHAPADPRMLVAPALLGGQARPANHLDTAHFTVEWSDDGVEPDVAAAVADALEAAWARLVVRDAWPAPPSSGRLRAILDPTLAATGFTATYDGVPVLYVNPAYPPDFVRSVAAHEFGHALQYGLRPAAGPADAWFWEATSEWLAELAVPDADAYAASTRWYAEAPDAAADSAANYHAYGMVVLTAYLDEHVLGAEGLRDVWLSGQPDWPTAIGDAAGADFGEVVADMSAALVAGDLREAHLYAAPVFADTLAMPGLHGTRYLRVSGAVDVEGDVTVRRVGDVLTVTSLGDGPLAFAPPPEERAGCAGSLLTLATAPAALRRRARSPRRGPPSGGPSRAPS